MTVWSVPPWAALRVTRAHWMSGPRLVLYPPWRGLAALVAMACLVVCACRVSWRATMAAL